MVQYTANLVKKCLLCQSNSARYPQLPKSYAITKGLRPFTHVVLDLFYLPKTSEGFRYVIVAVFSFTKWPEATSLKVRTSRKIMEWFHENVVCRFGTPEVVRTDNGGEFLGMFHDYLV